MCGNVQDDNPWSLAATMADLGFTQDEIDAVVEGPGDQPVVHIGLAANPTAALCGVPVVVTGWVEDRPPPTGTLVICDECRRLVLIDPDLDAEG